MMMIPNTTLYPLLPVLTGTLFNDADGKPKKILNKSPPGDPCNNDNDINSDDISNGDVTYFQVKF